ncbi:MAG: sigma-54-dependent Fis family transcriptional regulator [candidate division NC10 bacterium]|nr:sigma-54-dependent Fis family transcriptional regulator [candidate division NC10 bacterium]
MPEKRILVVDDEESVRWALSKALERAGYQVVLAADGPGGKREAADPAVELVLLDIRLPGQDGLAILREIRARRPDVPVIMMTAYGTLQVAVEAMKQGAYDYIGKPFDVDELLLVVEKALQARALAEEVARLRQATEGPFDLSGIVGGSPAMQQIFKAVGKVAGTDLTVLLRGESGTGKELFARAIHENSRRKGRPFVPVNCAAIPRDLLESELFGHERGAFTGAVSGRRGRFEQAEGGTVFLDEIGDMDLSLQTKLLRVLQERQIERLGAEGSIPVDVRIVAATNQELEAAVSRRAFREDLFYRLNVVSIHLPPLRDRREDLPGLVAHFLAAFAAEQRSAAKVVSPEALALLREYAWPGNVRELENVVKRAAALTTTPLILPDHLPEALHRSQPVPEGGGADRFPAEWIKRELQRLNGAQDGALQEYFVGCLERPLLELVLRRTGGNQLKAAELLGINRNTLRKRIKKLGLPLPKRDDPGEAASK